MITNWQNGIPRKRTILGKHKSGDGLPIEIKFQAQYDCFQRSYSPFAYELIGKYLLSLPPDTEYFIFEEHESGPEIIIFLAFGTAVLSLSKSIIDLVTTIINSRSKGIEKGDKSNYFINLIVRRKISNKKIDEEIALIITTNDPINSIEIEKNLNKALNKLLNQSKIAEETKKNRRKSKNKK